MVFQQHTFDSCFEVVLADTPESQRIHYNLRYQVYCDEMGYEDKSRFPDKMEYDEWDHHSVHFLVRDKLSKQWLGGLRLVYPQCFEFPFEHKCNDVAPISEEQYLQAVEISRLCVIKQARRVAQPGSEDLGGNVTMLRAYRQQSKSLMWGLYRAAVLYCARNGVKHWFILVSPSLAHAVKKEGFQMTQAGNPCEFRGQRIPYILDVDQILANPFWLTDYRNEYLRFSQLDRVAPAALKATASGRSQFGSVR
ncbi:PEP-CTERM/exosortase system-associated acyltransferase [Methylomonas sp. MED-D]|uniref:PEP-CTERM/exosortase system-associated acyltransferase n=1 Tax=Methylomonas TaxID=416 RepID=UPI0007C93C3B|nr:MULTISPECIES: PEP-CTERM/exosortase system-associated acyltransferase [Methylomonas]MDT4330177.1 PEP-CTERM/exosortase system-associated acyltransferase [Methylomonas sp. MV1]OHX38226.1 PEP-CTERM/exosortase system-associated acyltransferase [Methylomonas sp. LWB]WGS86685.1 PEP-CTERM/exosortase system-associated acyltransferase [Methylomonas sp. UP202]